ncbi:MAG: lipid-A-disaccharide synthase [Polyangiaceae bacterium]
MNPPGEHDALLVVCGEPSGDLMGAEALAALGRPAFGIGGPELRRAGLESLVPMERLSAMGLNAARKLFSLRRAFSEIERAVATRHPRVALLIGFSDFNARLGALLRRGGTRVVWYAPPQIWAWRAARGPKLLASADHFALLLPFEEALWRSLGARANYVGHPALGWYSAGVERVGGQVALLPGSRAHEVRRLWPILESAARLLRRAQPRLRFELALSPALPKPLRTELSRAARRAGFEASHAASPVLARAEVAICCSGTATLQSAVSGCPPLIVYPTSRLAELVLERLVRVQHVGLPNLVLDRRAFPELLGQAVKPKQVAEATLELAAALPRYRNACDELRTRLESSRALAPGKAVAELVEQYS